MAAARSTSKDTPKGTQPPRISAPVAPTFEFTDADAELLLARDDRERERFADADLTDYDLSGIRFAECELDTLTLTGTQLRGARFVETAIIRPFAPVLTAARTSWREVRVTSPRWGSAELFESDFTNVQISGGKIDFLNLRNCTLTDLLIEDCFLGELDLGGAKATRVAFRNCRIGTLDLTNATLHEVDLRGNEFAQINGLDGLRGATIDDYQLSLLAPVFAAHIGLRIE
jgi:uncharacterized protein YjbI with pentapeptide repeats